MDNRPSPDPAQRPAALLSTGSLFHLPLPRIGAMAARAGFAGLDLVMGSPAIAWGSAVRQAHALCPVRVVHAPFRNWSAWGGHKGAWSAAAELAGRLVGPGNPGVHVTLHPPAGTLRDAVQTRWLSRAVDLPRLLDVPPGVELSLENLPWAEGGGIFGRDALDALLEQCREKGLGLTLDVCHLGVSGRSPLADLSRIPAGLIRHVHFSDAQGHTEHLPPGRGELPLGPFLARLCAGGFAGTVSLELAPEHLPEAEDACVAELSRLRQGMEAAFAGRPPEDWVGRERQSRRNAVAALG